jgi:hypothetical protein
MEGTRMKRSINQWAALIAELREAGCDFVGYEEDMWSDLQAVHHAYEALRSRLNANHLSPRDESGKGELPR